MIKRCAILAYIYKNILLLTLGCYNGGVTQYYITISQKTYKYLRKII